MKSNSFSKKLLSAFLAILMAISCFTGVMSAYAGQDISADTEETLYDSNLAYNFLGWVEATDVQTLDALLDFADQMMGDALGGAVGKLDIAGAVINYDLSSINGLFSTLNSARQFLKSALVTVFLGDDAKLFNLGGCLKGYTANGGGGDVMTRQNSSSKELLRGIINILYMNGTSYAKNANNNDRVNAGGEVLQHLVNGTFSVGGLEGLIINIVKGMTGLKTSENSVYGVIGGLLGLQKGFEKNLANNIVVHLLKTLVADDLTKDNVNNKINTSGSTYYFVDDAGQRLSIEQWAFDAINNGVFQTLIGVDGEHIFQDEAGAPNFEINVNDSGNDDLYNAFVPIFQHTLLPLISTISLDFNYVTHFTKMYYSYVNQTEIAAPSTDAALNAYWSTEAINNWIEADYVEIGKYIGALQTPESTDENRIYKYPGMAVFNDKNEPTGLGEGIGAAEVKAAMLELFNSLDRHSEELDATKLFSCLLYSPVAAALGCETGILNLNLKDYYLTKHNLCNFFDWSVLPSNGSVKGNVYGLVKELLSFMFPTFNNWAPASAAQDVRGIVDEFVASAGNLIKFVGDSLSDTLFADYDTIDESNIEQAVLPLIRAILGEVDITKHIHDDEWNKCKDIEGYLYVALAEYLKYALPQYDYSCLVAKDADGKYELTIEDILPMARDALAYIMKPSVPIKDKAGNEWDVFEQGGTNNGALVDSTTTVFDMLNYLLCYYASDSSIAQLLNLTKYTMYGTEGAAGYESAITVDNTIWQNIDLIANKVFPLFAKWLGVTINGESKISSEQFVMDTLVNGLINIGDVNTSSFNHGEANLRGISTIFYNLVYMFTDSEVMNTPVLTVAYNFVRDIFNVILGPRDSGDGFGDFIPANTGVQPFTDAIQNRILGGGTVNPSADCAYSSYSSMGLIGILAGRIAENTLAGELYTKGKAGRDIVDTVTTGLTFILKSICDLTGLIPQLGEHQFTAPRAEFERSAITQAAVSVPIENQYISVENRAAGLNRAIFEDGASDVTQLTRYYIRVTDIQCINDSNLTVDKETRYQKNVDGSITADSKRLANIIDPATIAYYKVSGAVQEMGTKQFMVTYDIVDKGENLLDPSYTGLTTIASFFMTEDIAWYDQIYNGSREFYSFGGSGDMTEPNRTTYLDGLEATKTSSGFTKKPLATWANGPLTVLYPANIILEGGQPETFTNIRMRLNNLYTSGIGSCDRTMDGCFMYKHDASDAYNWAVPVFDDAGNVLKLDSTDYYYPAANGGAGAWIQDNSAYEENGTALQYTETRTHVEYTAEQVASTFGADHIRFENGVAKEVYVNYSTAKGKVTWGSPIKGVYINVDPIQIAKKEQRYFTWLAVESGVQSVEPGQYNFDVCFPNSDINGYANINVTIADTADRNTTSAVYKEADLFQSQYMESDFENLTAEDAQRLGMSTSDSYFDAIQSAIGTANAAISKQISTKVVANNEKIATNRTQVVATGVSDSIVGDLAYKQVTTELGNIGLEYYAVAKDEFGNANGTYYYMDKDGKYPYYTNTPVDATEANFNNSAYVFVNKETGAIVNTFVAADAAKYEVHYRNTEEYAKDWVFTYDTPYVAETSEKTGKYLAKQFKYAYGDGSAATSKKEWVFKYPDVITTNLPNSGSTDYRSEYLKQADLLTYVMEVAKEHVSSAGAARIVNEIIDDRKNLDENCFDMVTYRMMVKTAKMGEKLVKGTYETVFTRVTPSDDDENFEVTGSYDFYVKTGDTIDPQKDRHITNTTYNLFISNVAKGDYASLGIPSTAVEGDQFYFGKWDVAPEYLDEDKNIIYDWTTTSSGVAINEAIRMYELYKNEVVHRGYKDNDRAFMQEILCATGDTFNYNYNVDSLRSHTINAFDATYSTEQNSKGDTVITKGSGSVTFANAAATPKFGALENGVLVNKGAIKYTDESWANYVDALAAAVVAVDNAATSAGYTQGMYDDSLDYNHDINAIQNLRTGLMKAEDQLEEAAAATTATVTGKVVAMLDPSAPDAIDGAPALAGVTVTVGDQVATTDASGVFSLSLENGTYTAVIHYVYGYDRTITINVSGADIDAGTITMIPCDYDNNGSIDVNDSFEYYSALGVKDLVKGDINGDGKVDVNDSLIYLTYLGMRSVTNIYPAKTVG